MTVDMPVAISTQDHSIGIYSFGCTKCDVKKKWESKDPTRPQNLPEENLHV